ncbi:MAG: hypothetical protein IKS15_03650 [Opitutales bacterium]|nr:hypothetical protein [Opitutales bacterium]
MVRAIIKGDEFILLNGIEKFRYRHSNLASEWFKERNIPYPPNWGDDKIGIVPEWFQDINLTSEFRKRVYKDDVWDFEDYKDYSAKAEDDENAKMLKILAEEFVKDKNYKIETFYSAEVTPEEIRQLNLERTRVY